MSAKVHYTECPVCKSKKINPLFTAKDNIVSNEDFVIWQCSDCTVRFTQDVPDEQEIRAYYQSSDYISHSNTSKGFVNKLYLAVRKYTLKQKAKLITKYTDLSNGNILDMGCGVGAFLNAMNRVGWKPTGLEPDADARKLAKELFNLNVKGTDALPELPQNYFDAITLWHVLEHVHQLHNYLEHLKLLLKPNGKLFIAVPNYTSMDADVYRLHWAAYDVPRHLYHFTPKGMSALLQQHGLKLVAKKPMWFDSFYISLLSSKNKNGKTRMLSAFVTGLRSNIIAAYNKDRCSSLIYIIAKT
ncbi:MAG: class I SAM-dependent methyltransferase [Chitinophagaceae bacterium]